MAESSQEKARSCVKIEKDSKVNLSSVWELLNDMFKLDELHGEEEIELDIKDEIIYVKTGKGRPYKTGKRMLTENQWRCLSIWYQENLLFGKPMKIPRKQQESGSIISPGWEGELMRDELKDDTKERRREIEGRDGGMKEIINVTKSALESVGRQEYEINELTQSVNKLCNISAQALNKYQESVNKMEKMMTKSNEIIEKVNKEMIIWREERADETKRMRELRQMMRKDHEQQTETIYEIVNKLSDMFNRINKDEQEEEYEEQYGEERSKVKNFEDEPMRHQIGEENFEMRSSNPATVNNRRCYECHAFGHIGAKCPNKGQGIMCYLCKRIGNHKAIDCPDRPGYSKGCESWRGQMGPIKRTRGSVTMGETKRGRFNGHRSKP